MIYWRGNKEAAMIIWLNGAFGAGKTTCAYELRRRLPNSFVYDPENIGYFLRANLPRALYPGDFQDLPQWRGFNYELLRTLAREYAGDVIVPMTVTSVQYYDEIIGRLCADGVSVRHFVLYAGRETLRRRLNRRLARGETWAKAQIDRCVEAFDGGIIDERVVTDGLSVESIVEQLAERCGITLTPDTRGTLRRKLDRVLVLLRHIR
jgi:hypothetical protein